MTGTFSPIRVKLLLKAGRGKETPNLLRRFPGSVPEWGRCRFVLDYDARDYDWLVVYDDLPSIANERFPLWVEDLACPREHTLLITAEPSTIKTYGSRFLAQFGHVLTSQEPWVVRHPGAVFSQPALLWFYGRTDERGAYDRMSICEPGPKTSVISTVCSSKQQRHTLHQTRYRFVQSLSELLPELDVFGHGVRPIHDKAEALDSYKYHIAIENHFHAHHWTEKLADPFLGLCLPFYFGCPNAEEYFPADSFVRIDVRDPESAAKRIRAAILNNEYERRLPAIREARRRVLDRYGLIPTVSALVERLHDARRPAQPGARILSRHAFRRASLLNAVSHTWEKMCVGARHAWLRRFRATRF